MRLMLGQVAQWMAAVGAFDQDNVAVGYSIDSRTIGAGELFFAVKGERMDGHDYVQAALVNDAVAAVVSRGWTAPAGVDEKRLLRVQDSEPDGVLHAMQRLANRVRRQWGGRVIGVTGSAGKTTTKECVAQVLATTLSVLKSEGNLNNHFGLPLQLLRLQPEHEVAVLEMGMNHAGEIRALAKIAEPDWAVVSNVAAVHLEHFSDGVDGIARAKYELIEALPVNGIAVLNGDDERVRDFDRGMEDRALLYGTKDDADVRAFHIVDRGLNGTAFDVDVSRKLCAEPYSADVDPLLVELHLPGRHNVMNALAAIAVGVRSGIALVDCAAALATMRPTEKRGNMLRWRDAAIVNDTYNSNPQALMSMMEALGGTDAKRRIVVAGEMLELGPEAAALHARCGEFAAIKGIDVVLGVRGLARELAEAARQAGAAAEFVETPELAGEWLRANLCEGDVVVLKASRGVRLERALTVLEAEPESAAIYQPVKE
jgi:UDP-N-acetylmuramoyl-tripeptide--D-alanyl-D-alanine ligase